MKIKWVKKIERISDAGDVKESIYKPENGKGDISIETVKKAIRLQSGSRWETNSIQHWPKKIEELLEKKWQM